MKKITLLLISYISFSCFSEPIKSVIGAYNISHQEVENQSYSARDYIQDGLVAMWDGIENAGYSAHDSEATSWVNLVDNSSFRIGNGNYFDEDSLITTVATAFQTIPLYGIQDNNEYTFEVGGASLAVSTSICTLPYTGGPNFMSYASWNSSGGTYIKGCGGSLSIRSSDPLDTRKTFGLKVSGSNYTIYCKIYDAEKNGTWNKVSGRFDYGYISANVRLCFIRIYNRSLTDSEIEHNYQIDKVRFGL